MEGEKYEVHRAHESVQRLDIFLEITIAHMPLVDFLSYVDVLQVFCKVRMM